MQVHLKTLGCRLNEAELETWARKFRHQGHAVTAQPDEADLVVVNSCAVTEEAVRKSRKLIRRVQRSNPQAKLVVSGCYASLNPAEIKSIPGVDLLIENRDKDRLPEIVAEKLDTLSMPDTATEPGENLLFARGRQRAFIKVQDGCRYKCTFCIVTEARGEERSRPPQEIIDEINALHQQGVQEAVITGVHLGGYGSDCDSNLGQLVERLLKETSIPRLRLGSLEPWDIPDNFWSLFDNPRLMPHLHLPLQSGCDTVLRRMARRCKTAEFSSLLSEARKMIPGLNITTDIIVGFPGETDSEWQEGMDYLERLDFGHIHIFSYSPRPGTKAARLPNAVNDETRRSRSQQLHALADEMKQRCLDTMIGTQQEVLIETRSQDENGDWYWGYMPNYHRVRITASRDSLETTVTMIKITGSDSGSNLLHGEITPAA
ncbi:tRNA (N(6)-L-threonylcarbamoyladenosine(37)-C(2))-methylthiotransferase MtaB [Solemya velum gill symbiont]|uniref:tRNA (N(6)-L-threonylcarbamoyladenosine(37)-C(2))- methylthiotransferase MtaB n=1 Tax=Solemya velum gill symbiont TaxID=2340 RepID=UPI000996A6EB|nr:tRNA (N(6)-L-threonylcarbamoyladenosine(37)-C(2))-methylthiotransferase MtaB [Solemya velum gill symbiont]OOZ17367.1 tRNA (N(6)-L-threonylcarbamoyladenosine(37)-C(2))-methylthiotransferase MtaB [Solemya velum gill symbiont]OOZ27010.1 tRNA (N(6)-L-threonylcarbamoyladenosine(37)-C(2))-methylthiotransferase MtaB [Solemya velum gill symbiont]